MFTTFNYTFILKVLFLIWGFPTKITRPQFVYSNLLGGALERFFNIQNRLKSETKLIIVFQNFTLNPPLFNTIIH